MDTIISAQSTLEDQALNWSLPSNAFSDEDGDALSYSAQLANGSALPSWLSFNAATGAFTGTPDNAAVGDLSIKVMATDPKGASASQTFTLTVANVNDAPEAIGHLADAKAKQDQVFNWTLPTDNFKDIDLGDRLHYTATLADGTALPSWHRVGAR